MTQPHSDASICFVSKDKDHLELVKQVMQSEHTIHSQGKGCFRLPIGSKRLWNDLYDLGGRPAKSLVAELPYIPQLYRRPFICGFVDGDGSLYWETVPRKRPMLFIIGGISFLGSLASIIDQETSVGVSPVRVNENNTPRLTYSGIKAQVLARWMYTSGDVMLERKWLLAQEFQTWELSKFGWKSQSVLTSRMREILEM